MEQRIGIWRIGLTALAALCLAGNASAQTCVDPPRGMISWWPGDGDAEDVAGDLDGAVLDGAGFVAGMVGDAFAFDGVGGGQDDQVVLSHLAMDGLADLTVELWVNTTDDNGALFSGANGDDPGGNEFLIFQAPTGFRVIVNGTGSGDLPTVNVDDGLWHHVALVREGEMGRVYVDGAMVDERPYPMGSLSVGPRGLVLGQEQDCLAGCFSVNQALDGVVDEVTVYGRALSEGEVLAIADAGSAGKCKPEVMPPTGPMDEDMAVRMEELEMDVDALLEHMAELEARVQFVEDNAHVHESKHKKWKKWKKKWGKWHDHHDDD